MRADRPSAGPRHGLRRTLGSALLVPLLLTGPVTLSTRSHDRGVGTGAPQAGAAARSLEARSLDARSPVGRVPVGQVPVVLVPGWLDTARDLAALRIRLLAAGWPSDHIATVTFREPTGGNREHAEELRVIIDSLLAQTGVDSVDVVAHSMGGLATRWYLLSTPEHPVRRAAFLASPHRGTLSAHLAWGGGRDEMMPESAFLDSLNAHPPVPDGVRAITIRTTVDTHIVPGESATLPGIPDHEVCCPTHAGMLHDDEVFDLVLRFLDGA